MKINQLLMLSAVRRMPSLLAWLYKCQQLGQESVAVAQIAQGLNIPAALIQADLQTIAADCLEAESVAVPAAITALESALEQLKEQVEAVLVAAGVLGDILAKTRGFAGPGVKTLAIFSDQGKEQVAANGICCYPLDKVENLTKRLNAPLAILCVPHAAAQKFADLLVKAGVTGIWNWSGTDITVPGQVAVWREDHFASELGLVQQA